MVAENIMEYCITFYIKKEKNISMHGDPAKRGANNYSYISWLLVQRMESMIHVIRSSFVWSTRKPIRDVNESTSFIHILQTNFDNLTFYKCLE